MNGRRLDWNKDRIRELSGTPWMGEEIFPGDDAVGPGPLTRPPPVKWPKREKPKSHVLHVLDAYLRSRGKPGLLPKRKKRRGVNTPFFGRRKRR